VIPPFLKYFFIFIFRGRQKQRLLFLALSGVAISSFSLLVLQSTMGGLQNSMVEKSKNILGDALIQFSKQDSVFVQGVEQSIRKKGLKTQAELVLEVLLRHENFISPAIAHGIDPLSPPSYLTEYKRATAEFGIDLGHKLQMAPGSNITIISPSHTDSFMDDIPRSANIDVGHFKNFSIPELDASHFFVRKSLLQNIVGDLSLNTLRIWGDYDYEVLKLELRAKYLGQLELLTWEDQHSTLVYSLQLESMVMIFLFIAMTFLVSICIISGLLIFFDKIKVDLAGLYILGAGQDKIQKSFSLFLIVITHLSTLSGLLLAFFALWLLDFYAPNIMPEMFVERKIPIHITKTGVFISYLIPQGMAYLFSLFSMWHFKKESDWLTFLRGY